MENEVVFVTIGHPNSLTAVVKRIPVRIDGESESQKKNHLKRKVGKLLTLFCENPWMLGFPRQLGGFVPGEFYWAAFGNFDDRTPAKTSTGNYLASDNFFWRRK